MDRKIKIYKAYITRGDKTVEDIAKEFGVDRSLVYKFVNQIKKGNQSKIKTCTEKSRLGCLWEHKYKTIASLLPKNRKKETVNMLKDIINSMSKDGFGAPEIARRLKKDRTTIEHHLTK